jgi:1,2-dihydroxy-3-keto-5-methylthiopentene dioxygenase
MADLIFVDGRTATATELGVLAAQFGIIVDHRPVPADLLSLLARPLLDAEATERILDRFPPQPPYPSRDIIVLHPARPDNADLATRFERWHRHDGDEVRYILDGRGIFRLLLDNEVADLNVGPGDFIRVPGGLEHSFHLDESQRIKAIRYLGDPSGWVAVFTGRSDVAPPVRRRNG